MGRKPLSPDGPSKPTNLRLSFTEDVILTQLEAKTGYSRAQLIRMAVRALPVVASGFNRHPTTPEFEQLMNASVFQAQLKEIEQEHEAEILTEIAKKIGPDGRYNERYSPGQK
jgi:hypothetical protein